MREAKSEREGENMQVMSNYSDLETLKGENRCGKLRGKRGGGGEGEGEDFLQ